MATSSGLGGSPYNSAAATLNSYPRFDTAEEVASSGLIRPRTFVDVREPGGLIRTYFVTDNPYIMWDITSGGAIKETQLNELVGKRIQITPTPRSKVTSIKMIGAQVAESAEKSLKTITGRPSTGDQGFVRIGMNAFDASDISAEIERVAGEEKQALQQVLNFSNTVKIRNVASVDFETRVVQKAHMTSRDVISGAIAKVQDYRFSMPDLGEMQNTPGIREFGYNRARATEYFNLSALKEWTSGGTTVPDLNSLDGVGKKQIFAFYDAVRETHNRNLESRMERLNTRIRSAEAEMRTRGSSLSNAEASRLRKTIKRDTYKVERLRGRRVDTSFLDEYITKDHSIENISKEFADNANKMRNTMRLVFRQANEHFRGNPLVPGTDGSFTAAAIGMPVGTVTEEANNITKIRGNPEETMRSTYQKRVMLTESVPLAIANEIVTNSGNVGMFGNMEANVLDSAEKELDLAIDKGRREGKDISPLISQRTLVQTAKKKLVDVKVASQALLNKITDTHRYATQMSSGLISDSLLKLGVDRGTVEDINSRLSQNFLEGRMKGTSMEVIREILAGREIGKTAHTAAADSRDLSELVVRILDGKDTEQIVMPTENQLDLRTGHPMSDQRSSFIYTLERGGRQSYELAFSVSKEMQIRQAAAMLVEKKDRNYLKGLLGKMGTQVSEDWSKVGKLGEEATEKLYGRSLGDALENELAKGLRETIDVRGTDVSDIYEEYTDRVSRFSAQQPGVVKRAFTGFIFRRVVALKFANMIDNWLRPGETDDHGTHASTETVARRIAMTDFGSKIMKGLRPAAAKLLKKIDTWQNRGSVDKYQYLTEGHKALTLQDQIYARNPTWGMTIQDSAKRTLKKKGMEDEAMEGLGEYISSDVGTDLETLQDAVSEMEAANLNNSFRFYKRSAKYTHFKMKEEIEKVQTSMKVPVDEYRGHRPVSDHDVNLRDQIEMATGGYSFSSYMKPETPFMRHHNMAAPMTSTMKPGIQLKSSSEHIKRQQLLISNTRAQRNVEKQEPIDTPLEYVTNTSHIDPPLMHETQRTVEIPTTTDHMGNMYKQGGWEPEVLQNPDTLKRLPTLMDVPQSKGMKPIPYTALRPGARGPETQMRVPEPSLGPAKGYHILPDPDVAKSITQFAPHRRHVVKFDDSVSDHHADFKYMVNTHGGRNNYPGTGAPGTADGLVGKALQSTEKY